MATGVSASDEVGGWHPGSCAARPACARSYDLSGSGATRFTAIHRGVSPGGANPISSRYLLTVEES